MVAIVCLLLAPPCRAAATAATIDKADLGRRFLLQTSYEYDTGWHDFHTSRSRIVIFVRRDGTLRMLEPHEHAIQPYRVIADIPIVEETPSALRVDFNAGFDEIFKQEDRTGEDYYGRIDRADYSSIRLTRHELVDVSREEEILVLEQQGIDSDGQRVVVHYYLSPYRRNRHFAPFEMRNLDHFGFYETYPQRQSGRTVLYAMKFATHEPIVFTLSGEIPAAHKRAVRDGVLYWNRAFGTPLIQVIDAPDGVTAPSAHYNIIQWVSDENHGSTSHIQSDPLTGEILRAIIFVRPQALGKQRDLETRNDHLRYVVAHEVGHALGLRHNLADGAVTTVMSYFPFEETVRIGARIIEPHAKALEYDRKVIRHVYLGERITLDTLPAFCTDSQAGCSPFPKLRPCARALNPEPARGIEHDLPPDVVRESIAVAGGCSSVSRSSNQTPRAGTQREE